MDSPSSGLRPAHSEAPAVHYLQQTFESSHQLRASDIHFEPFENFYRVRLRIDGVLQEITPPPFEFREHIASRIKVLAHLDIAEKRLPQDGRMSIGLHNAQKLHLRISTLPTLFGEKLVVRTLTNDPPNWTDSGCSFNPLDNKITCALSTFERKSTWLLYQHSNSAQLLNQQACLQSNFVVGN
jgi:type IV pilus assembly protein PilB